MDFTYITTAHGPQAAATSKQTYKMVQTFILIRPKAWFKPASLKKYVVRILRGDELPFLVIFVVTKNR